MNKQKKIDIKFSIIIPVKAINDYVRENILYIQKLEYSNWDLYVLPNEVHENEWNDKRIKVISTGKVSPARKRDIGAAASDAEILVFLDDDSFPERNLLNIAIQYFSNEAVLGLGGPGITPINNSFLQKVSGAVFLSKLSGGFPERYISLGEVKQVDDWPSVNLMIRRDAFLDVGGFDSDFWPGEDTYLCEKLKSFSNKTILYLPNMVVWHHRRPGLLQHLKQIGAYALHRGFFVKSGFKTSLKIKYFIPSLFFLFTVASLPIFVLFNELAHLVIVLWILYLIALGKALFDIQKYESWMVASCAILYIFPTHLWYGFQFLIGLCRKNLKSNLR